MSKLIDLTGKTFGLLTVIEKSDTVFSNTKRKKIYWKCLCSCGNYHTVFGALLRNGEIKNCGQHFDLTKRFVVPRIVSANAIYYHHNYGEADITFEKFLEMSQMNCHYCGSAPAHTVNKCPKNRPRYDQYQFTYNGLDRVDNSLSHTLANCVTCCFTCNVAKHNMSKQQFFDWLERVYKHSLCK
jgi:5-methylcytosine-specific restriction endonuclease McrA